MKVRVQGWAVAGLVLLAGAGCTTAPVQQSETSEEQQIRLALQKIGDATLLAANAQQELALTADAKVQRDMALRRRLLTDATSYDFYGDVEDIVREIAVKYGYDFNVYGKRPPERVNVNVFVTKKPVVEVLKQIGYASTNALDVHLKRDAIEIHYKSK